MDLNVIRDWSVFTPISSRSARPLLQKPVWTLLVLVCLLLMWQSDPAQGRAGYAKWVKHGDAYRVSGSFSNYSGSFRVQVKWRGNRFVVQTPLGTFPLKRAGAGVTFRVRFENAWASVRWIRNRASVVYKGKRGSVVVKKLSGGSAVVKNLSKRQPRQFRNDTLK